jgi:hypothetical protein
VLKNVDRELICRQHGFDYQMLVVAEWSPEGWSVSNGMARVETSEAG